MRKALVAFVVALLLPLSGGPRDSSVVTQLLPTPGQLPGFQGAWNFWYSRSGGTRAALSMPADQRMTVAYAHVQVRARKLNLKFEAPVLRRTKPELVLLLGPGIRYFFAMHYLGPRTILANSWWTDQMSDMELQMLLAHELAHAVDVQSEREGPLLSVFSGTDNDDFVADAIAMLMFDHAAYQAYLEKFQLK